eukprot:COSAG01_NODE_1433_length_10317_cov_590.337366_6_plen_247_part_00
MTAIRAIVLAAGKGTRMGGDCPKVLMPIQGQPMLTYTLSSLQRLGNCKLTLVLGYQADRVKAAMSHLAFNVALQEEQLGTGHAVQQALPQILAGSEEEILILPGDCPFIQPQTLSALIQTYRQHQAKGAVLTAELDEPATYGRVLKDAQGQVSAIREFKDCSAAEKQIREINSGIYLFDRQSLISALKTLGTNNAQQEYYLPDVIAWLKKDKQVVISQQVSCTDEILGANTPEELAFLESRAPKYK